MIETTIETIIGHFQHRILSTWLILDQVFAGRRHPRFPNLLTNYEARGRKIGRP